MNYWSVGSTHSKTDVTEEFLKNGIWYDGYAEEGDLRNENSLKNVQVGDVLLMKSTT